MIQAQLQDKFPPTDRRVAVNSQRWVTGSPIALGIPNPPPPVGRQYLPHSFPPKDRRVAVSSQDWVTRWSALQMGAVPSATLPPGLQYFPARFDPTDRSAAVKSQARLITLPLSTVAAASFSGSGVFTAVGVASNLAVAAFSGAGAFNGVSAQTGTAVASFVGSSAFSGVGVGPPPAVALWTGSGSFSGATATTTTSVAAWSGAGFFSASAFTSNTVANFTGGGVFNAVGGWSNNLPFNYPPSWSIMLYDSIIEGCGYDPITRNLKVWFTNTLGQFVILQNLSDQVTNAIDLASDQQAYVLALIKSNVGVPLPGPPPPPAPPPPPPPPPTWVTALRAPSGSLPGIALDFQNGRYWGNGSVRNLSDLVDQNLNWGTWNPSIILPGFGVLSNEAQPCHGHIIQSMYGASWLANGITVLMQAVGHPVTFNTPGFTASCNPELDIYENSFANDMPMIMSITDTTNVLNVDALSGGGNIFTLVTMNPTTSGAANLTWPNYALSAQGHPVANGGPQSNPSIPLTDIAFGDFGLTTTGDATYISLIAIYDLQPASDLPAISAL